MPTKQRNRYIIGRAFRTSFFASVLVSVVSQFNTLVDSIIVSHLVSPDAISAIGLSSPISIILFLLHNMICTGAAIHVVQEIGMQNYAKVNHIFVTSLIVSVLSILIVSTPMFLYSTEICQLMTSEARLLPLLEEYIEVIILGGVINVLHLILIMFVKSEGFPRVVTRTILVECVFNVLLDLLLVGGLHLGIAGAAWGTVVSGLLSTGVLIPHLKSTRSVYHFIRPQRQWLIPTLKAILHKGVPSAVGILCLALMLVILNMVVLKTQGATGMFILSVSLQVISLCMLVLNGSSSAIVNIGGVMLGENDIDGYRSLVNGILKYAALALLAVTMLLFAFPEWIATMFGVEGEMMADVVGPLRQMCFMYFPIGFVQLLTNAYNLQGHPKLASTAMTLVVICMIPIVWVTSVYCPSFLWIAIPMGLWLVILLVMVMTYLTARKSASLHWLTLIPLLPNAPSITCSVKYNRESVHRKLGDIHLFLDICELPHEVYYRIDTCIEEIAHNLVSRAEGRRKKGSFDIRVTDDGEYIRIVIKDDGLPYNPILKFDAANIEATEEKDLPLVLLNGMCDDISYKYMNGINCTYLNFKYR